MDRADAATDSLKLHSMDLKHLTHRIACDIIPPLKASALWSRDGLEMEGTVLMVPVINSSESQRSCSTATIHT